MAANDEQHLLPAPNAAANAGRAEDNFIEPQEHNEDGDGEGNPEQELNGWLDVRECFQREKILGILSCAAFGGSTSAFLSSSLALLAFRHGHPPAVSFIIPILGWTGIGSGAHLALRNKTKLCMYLWPVSLAVAFALMRYGATNVATSIALLILLATANFFGCSLCACLLMNAEYVLPSLGPLLLYRHIPTLSIMICSMAGYYYNGFKSLQDLFSNSVSVLAIILYVFDLETRRRISPLTDSLLQFKTSFDAKQELSSPIVYSDEIMGVSGAAAAGVPIPNAFMFYSCIYSLSAAFFSGITLGAVSGFFMPCMWWLIFFLGSLLEYSLFLYRTNLPHVMRRLPLSLQRFFHPAQAQQIQLQ